MNKGRICFLVGSMAISGGTYVIVQHASYLHDQGYAVTLAVQTPFTEETLAWHDKAAQLRCVPIEDAKREDFDLVIATWWKTALELQDFNASRYAYFVQSIESRFYPPSETALRELVDSTYGLPVAYVTEAAWIRDYLSVNFGHETTLVRNGVRKDLYRPTGVTVTAREPERQPRVLVEGHFGVAFKNTALGVRLAREAGAKDIWVLTGTPVKWLPGVSRVFSQIPMNKTPEIYRSCDILIKLSTVEGMFGPPLEIFHCGGTAVVFDVTGHDEYIIHDLNACVVRRGDIDGVVSTLRHLLSDRAALARIQAGALRTAEAWSSWGESSAAFNSWVDKVLVAESTTRRADIAALNSKAMSDYVSSEQLGLTTMSRQTGRDRMKALAVKLPPALLRAFKQTEAIREVLWGARQVR